jgi:Ca2+:H+ antiporter
MTSANVRRWTFQYLWYILIPISIWLYLAHFDPIAVFIMAILAVLPLTNLIAKSTQQLSMRTTTILGSLMNATFGNAIEFMIAIFAIQAGLIELVKASITGSIILNILLLIGLSMLLGGFKYREQTFSKDSAGVASSMLLIAVAGLSMPTIYTVITGKSAIIMSRAVSVALGITYLLSLVFVLVTHRHLFEAKRDVTEELSWGLKRSTLVLLVSIGLAALESHILVDAVHPLIDAAHLSETFVGLVIIAIITNVPEHLAAIGYGRRNNITLSLEIGMNSAIQIALFVAPILVFISPLLASEMSLAFPLFQMVAMILTVMIISYISVDGICNWLEGVQLVGVYIIIAVAFYFS